MAPPVVFEALCENQAAHLVVSFLLCFSTSLSNNIITYRDNFHTKIPVLQVIYKWCCYALVHSEVWALTRDFRGLGRHDHRIRLVTSRFPLEMNAAWLWCCDTTALTVISTSSILFNLTNYFGAAAITDVLFQRSGKGEVDEVRPGTAALSRLSVSCQCERKKASV